MTMIRAAMVLLCWFFLVAAAPAGGFRAAERHGGARAQHVARKKHGKKKQQASAEDRKLAKELNRKAKKLYEKGDYEGALAYFLKSQELDPKTFALFYIGKCYESLYKYEEAYNYYQKYIDSGEKANYDEVIEAVSRIETMPVIMKVITTPEGATVFIDGEEVTFQKTPVVSEVQPGKHKVVLKKKGCRDVVETLDIPYGGVGKIDVKLETIGESAAYPDEEGGGEKGTGEEEEVEVEEEIEEETGGGPGEERDEESVSIEKKRRRTPVEVPISISFGAGVTVSTTEVMGSYVDASLAVYYRIKRFFVGIGLDNLFFIDGYLLAAYPAGGYTLHVWKDLSLSFAGGFGAAYLHAFKEGYDPDGDLIVEKGGHWDLVAHADAKVRYKLGPVMIQAIPLHVDVLIGVGSIRPAPLAQFAFLVGVACDF